jgi:hypothetical protein
LGRLMGAAQDIGSVDLNPVILYDAGNGCLAVDAVVLRAVSMGNASESASTTSVELG